MVLVLNAEHMEQIFIEDGQPTNSGMIAFLTLTVITGRFKLFNNVIIFQFECTLKPSTHTTVRNISDNIINIKVTNMLGKRKAENKHLIYIISLPTLNMPQSFNGPLQEIATLL